MIKLSTCALQPPGTFSVQKSTHLSTDMFSMSRLTGRAMETLSGWRKHPRNIALPSARDRGITGVLGAMLTQPQGAAPQKSCCYTLCTPGPGTGVSVCPHVSMPIASSSCSSAQQPLFSSSHHPPASLEGLNKHRDEILRDRVLCQCWFMIGLDDLERIPMVCMRKTTSDTDLNPTKPPPGSHSTGTLGLPPTGTTRGPPTSRPSQDINATNLHLLADSWASSRR